MHASANTDAINMEGFIFWNNGGYTISCGHCFPLLNMLLPSHSVMHAISHRTGKNG